jgi:hypothetical protein
MEATCSSKTSANFQLTTWRYIPVDKTLLTVGCLMNDEWEETWKEAMSPNGGTTPALARRDRGKTLGPVVSQLNPVHRISPESVLILSYYLGFLH